MIRSLLTRMVIATFICLLLLSALPAPDLSASDAPDQPEIRYRLLAANDLAALKASVGVREQGRDYNVIIGGFGTGLAPPSESEWDLSVGTTYLDLGGDDYQVPTAASLDLSAEPYFPQVRSQGSEGSCAAFALTYYNYGYIEALDNGWTQAKTGNDSQLLSPSWTYNKVNGVGHEGSGYSENGRILQQIGAATWAAYPYVASDDEGFGPEAAWRSAPSHRVSSYVMVYNPSPSEVVSIVKEQLGLHRPVSFAMDANQYSNAFADSNYIMSAAEYSHSSYNHGQTIVGYDDAVTDDGEVGAFKVVNSWGGSWGQGGYYWVTYQAIKEMLGFPFAYINDLEDHQPTLVATWEFSTAPSVDTKVEVGSGSSTSPSAKVSTYFSSGTSNRLSGFMALDVSALYSKYLDGEKNYYLKLSGSSLSGTVSSFRLELHVPIYRPGDPTQVLFTSDDVPKAVPGTVTATISSDPVEDTTPPTSKVQALPTYVNSSMVTLSVTSSDTGSGVDHLELYYRYNAQGSYLEYAPSSNPTGNWTGGSISFDVSEAQGQGPYQFYSVAVDMAGNREAAPASPDASTTVDTGAPISSLALQGTSGTNGWYITNVTATLSASDQWSGISSIKYRLNGGAWTTYTGALVLTQGIQGLDYYAIDQAGNLEVSRNEQVKVDTSAPTVTMEVNATPTNGWYRSAVQVALSAQDALDPSCIISYRLNGGTWTSYTSAISISAEGTTTLEYYAKDQTGNQGTAQSKQIKIDRTAPVSSISLSGTALNGYFTSTVSATLTATDSGSGAGTISYRLNGGAWTTYASSISISAEGTNTLEYYATDVAGNTEAVRSMQIKIDRTAPVSSISLSGTAGLNGYFTSTVSATLTATDAISGVSSLNYRLNGGAWAQYSAPISISAEGTTTLEYYAVDQAGNSEAVRSTVIKIDRTAPVSSLSLSGTAGLNGYYTSAVSATLSSTDGGSGAGTISYRLNGGVWTTYASSISISSDGTTTLDYYATDLAGNQGPVQSKQIKIDRTAPGCGHTIEGQMDGQGSYISAVNVTLVTSDAGSGVSQAVYRVDGGNWAVYTSAFQISGDGNRSFEYYATDLAGNQGSVVKVELRIDSTGPSVEMRTDRSPAAGWFDGPVTITLIGRDSNNSSCLVHYRLDGGQWQGYTVPFLMDQEGWHDLEYYAVDLAGNQGPVGAAAFGIDSTVPECQVTLGGTLGLNEHYVSRVLMSLSATDAGSGANYVMYRLDGGEWSIYAGTISVDRDGTTALEFYAVDLAGNHGETQSRTFDIDRTAPECSITLTGTAGLNGYYTSTITATLAATDEGSGVSSLLYRLNGGSWTTYAGAISISADGTTTLEHYAADLAGNTGVIMSRAFNIDTTAPECAMMVSGTFDQDGYYVSAVTVSFTSSDGGSGADQVWYRLNAGTWVAYSGEISITTEGNTTLEFYAVDMAGNQGPVGSGSISIRPDISGAMVYATTDVMPVSGWFSSTVMVTLTPAAGFEGCEVRYSLNGGNWTLYAGALPVTAEGENLLEWYGTEQGGAKGETYSRLLMLDLTAPECGSYVNGAPGMGGWYAATVNVTLSAQDQGSGVDSLLYRLNDGEWRSYSTRVEVSEEGWHHLEFYAMDIAGNSGAVIFVEFGIDTVAPAISFLPLSAVLEDGTYPNQLSARLTAEDGESGILVMNYRIGDPEWRPVEGDILVQGEGAHLIECQAVDRAGNHAYFEVSVEISTASEAPGAVQALVATITDDGILLQWSPSPSGMDLRYLIYRSSEGEEELIANVTETSYLDREVMEGVSYDYRVVAVNSAGQGPSEQVLGLVVTTGADAMPYLLMVLAIVAVVGVALLLRRRSR